MAVVPLPSIAEAFPSEILGYTPDFVFSNASLSIPDPKTVCLQAVARARAHKVNFKPGGRDRADLLAQTQAELKGLAHEVRYSSSISSASVTGSPGRGKDPTRNRRKLLVRYRKNLRQKSEPGDLPAYIRKAFDGIPFPELLGAGAVLPITCPTPEPPTVLEYGDQQWTDIATAVMGTLPIDTNPRPCAQPGSLAFARYFDYTLLRDDATSDQVDELCTDAVQYGFKAVCIRPEFVAQAAAAVKDSEVLVCAVINFPNGADTIRKIVADATAAVRHGAHELDFVVNYPLLLTMQFQRAHDSIKAVRMACPTPTVLKVTLEVSQLSRFQTVAGCLLAERAGADFVTTGTGTLGRGAVPWDLFVMTAAAASFGTGQMGRKAIAGVRDIYDCIWLIQAGATRIGTSLAVNLMDSARRLEGDDETSSQQLSQ
ncbi:MAG: hypothetical protein M1833_006024 [Piccolia ochrophora]|nr:MAG: hypothetical protein M1833_006024 [Piccolia ochrophora]